MNLTLQWCAECNGWKEHGTWQHKSSPICDYCNNPVPSGKHVHEQCVERFDAREEEADRDNESQ